MKVKILIGNIASGKSSWVMSQKKDVKVISKDDIRRLVGSFVGNKYLYNIEIEELVHSISLDFYEVMLKLNVPCIIIDEVNITKIDREIYIALAKKYDYEVEALLFPDKGEEEHIKRRIKQPIYGNTSEKTWRDIYNINKKFYEAPEKDEGFNKITSKSGVENAFTSRI